MYFICLFTETTIVKIRQGKRKQFFTNITCLRMAKMFNRQSICCLLNVLFSGDRQPGSARRLTRIKRHTRRVAAVSGTYRGSEGLKEIYNFIKMHAYGTTTVLIDSHR